MSPQTPRGTIEAFYSSVADFLKNDLEDATEAVSLGGAGLKQKWGTPDVVGVFKSKAYHVVKFNTDVIAVEVKTDPTQPVVAFGQAVAYRLFANKAYIFIVDSLSSENLERLEALCNLLGVGLVLFTGNPETPNYRLKLPAQRHSADPYYVNKFADDLKQHDHPAFDKLFG